MAALATTRPVVLRPALTRVVTLLPTTAMRSPGSNAVLLLQPAMWLPGNNAVSTVPVTTTDLVTTDLATTALPPGLSRTGAATLVAMAATVPRVDMVRPVLLLLGNSSSNNSKLSPVLRLLTDMEATAMLPPVCLLLPLAWLLGLTALLPLALLPVLLLDLLVLVALPRLLLLVMDLLPLLPATTLPRPLLRRKCSFD